MSFYVTIPSNSKDFANNSTSNFSVHLPYQLHLTNQWELALTDIVYPHSWNNVLESPHNEFQLFYENTQDWITVQVPAGYYDNITMLIEAMQWAYKTTIQNHFSEIQYDINEVDIYKYNEKLAVEDETDIMKLIKSAKINNINEKTPVYLINDEILNYVNALHFSYVVHNQRVQIKMDTTQIKAIKFSAHLKHVLGFENSLNLKPVVQAKYSPDLKAGFYALYVYSNLVENQLVGSMQVPLLRIVPIEGIQGQIVEKIYNSPHYVNLLCKDFDVIEINIKNDQNYFVPFESGKVIVTLHFRKVQKSNWQL